VTAVADGDIGRLTPGSGGRREQAPAGGGRREQAPAGGGRREQAKSERRSRIVRAARDLIRETGDTDLSMRMIAGRAGVSLTTPYNLFGSKRAVVLAVFEDERDFLVRFSRLKAATAIDRIFDANDLAIGYFLDDPDFYRTLWKALLNTQGAESTGLATPERLERNRAGWRALLEAAQGEGLLDPAITSDTLERALSCLSGGAMLAWATDALPTAALGPTTALGYALALRGAATPAGAVILQSRIVRCQAILAGGGLGGSVTLDVRV
jgi:AcrR family transcriptional regulator